MPTGLMRGRHEEEAEQKQRLLVPKGNLQMVTLSSRGRGGRGGRLPGSQGKGVQSPSLDSGTLTLSICYDAQ